MQRWIDAERERYGRRGLLFRVAWVVAGVIVVAAGVAMLVFPGPAVLVIPIGLAMLSLEFAWAQRLLDKGFQSGRAAQELAANATTEQKAFAAVAAICAVAAVTVVAVVVLT
jgi:uncharacterized protein (TIGR02611 family)